MLNLATKYSDQYQIDDSKDESRIVCEHGYIVAWSDDRLAAFVPAADQLRTKWMRSIPLVSEYGAGDDIEFRFDVAHFEQAADTLKPLPADAE
jgi:hypothetical protein